jgi:hypothetical protein
MVNELRHIYSLSVLFAFFLFSCSEEKKPGVKELADKQTSAEVMAAFSEIQKEPDAKITQEIAEIKYSVQWVPPVVMAARAGDKAANVADVDAYDDFINIDLSVTTPGHLEFLKFDLTSAAEYDRRVKYSAFDMQRDIYFVSENNDTIPCVIFHFERNYDVSQTGKFSLGFPCEKCRKGTIVFEDRLFNNGKIKLLIDGHENT